MKSIYLSVVAALYSAALYAQGEATTSNVDVNLKSDSGGFSWIWIVGILVFIVLLVALLGGRGGTDRVVEKRTVIK